MTGAARAEFVRFLAREEVERRQQEAATGRPRAELVVTESDGPPILRLYDVIDDWGGWWGISATEVAAALDDLNDRPEVHVHVNSPGGIATEGVAIANLLRQFPGKVVAIVDGLAASAASMVLTGATEVVMAPSSQMMIHEASSGAWGPADFLRKEAEVLDHLSDRYAEAYARKAGGDPAAWRELMKAETWYSPDEAVEAGLADSVLEAAEATNDPEAAVARHDLRPFAYAGRQQAPAPQSPVPPSATGSSNTAQEADMSLSDALRERLGIADEDATEDIILAALDEALTEAADPPTDPTTVSPEALAEVTRLSTELAELKAQAAKREKDEQFASWLRDGKTSAAERAQLEAMYDAAPAQTSALVNARARGSVVPVDLIGLEDDGEASAEDRLFAELFGDDKTKVS